MPSPRHPPPFHWPYSREQRLWDSIKAPNKVAMPKNIPPEFIGRFSVKEKSSRQSGSKTPDNKHGNASPRSERPSSSASSRSLSYEGRQARGASVSSIPSQRTDRKRLSPAARSDPGVPKRRRTEDKELQSSLEDDHAQAQQALIDAYNTLEDSVTCRPSSYRNSPSVMSPGDEIRREEPAVGMYTSVRSIFVPCSFKETETCWEGFQ